MSPQSEPINKTISPGLVNTIGLILMFPIGLLTLIPYWLVWHEIALSGFNAVIILVALIPSVIIHEMLHGVGYLLGGAKIGEVKFGFLVRKLLPYAHCKVPLSAAGYRLGVALPGLILGVLPLIIGLLAHDPTLTVYAIAMILAAVGDLITLVMLVPVPNNARVQDHPSKPGFQILP